MIGHSAVCIELIRSSLASNIPEDKQLLFVIDAYFDESGTHASSEYVVIAGLWAKPSYWIKFAKEWQEVLSTYQLPFFHMSDFANQAPPFDNLPEHLRRQMLMRFLTVIKSSVEVSAAFVVPTTLFNSYLSAAERQQYGGAYGAALMSLISIQAGAFRDTVRDIDLDVWCNYIFEMGAPNYSIIAKVLDERHKAEKFNEHFRLAGLSFFDKRHYLPLQAADILAYEIYRRLPKSLDDVTDARFPMQFLAEIPHAWGIANERIFEQMKKAAAKHIP